MQIFQKKEEDEKMSTGSGQMSNSKAKREKRRQDLEQAKKAEKRGKLITWVVILAVIAVFAVGIGTSIYAKASITKPNSNYSDMVTEAGAVKNADVKSAVTLPDYKNVTFPMSDIEYSDESVEADIQNQLESHKVLNEDASLTAADGDTLNIDYVGKVDGVAFEGGDTQGNGTDLTLGSGSYIDTFEEQLVGTHPGDEVLVKVTFPEDYQAEELKGKAAEFEVVVNGIYELGTFDDAFVAENLSSYATTVEGYRTYLKESHYATNLKSAVQNYVNDQANGTAPKAYVKGLKSIIRYEEENYFNSYNAFYQAYMGQNAYNSFEEYTGKNEKEYEVYLKEEAEKRAALNMTYQAIFEDAGLTVSDDAFDAKKTEVGEETAATYGDNYIKQLAMQDAVVEYLTGIAIVE